MNVGFYINIKSNIFQLFRIRFEKMQMHYDIIDKSSQKITGSPIKH